MRRGIVGKMVTIIDGYQPKIGRFVFDDDFNKIYLPEVPYHNFNKGDTVKVIGTKDDELVCEREGMKQHIKRRFIRV